MSSSIEFTQDCEDVLWNHDKSTSHRSETNGIAERAVSGVKRWDFDSVSPFRVR